MSTADPALSPVDIESDRLLALLKAVFLGPPIKHYNPKCVCSFCTNTRSGLSAKDLAFVNTVTDLVDGRSLSMAASSDGEDN